MAQLGGTHNPKDLVPGDPAEVRTTANTMMRFATALILAGDGLKKIDDGGWTGPTAEKFHDEFDSEPARWTKCGDAFDDAAQALTSYASTLEWAQGQAKEAIALWDEAETATKQATVEYEAKVQKAALDPLNYGGMPIPFHDPGEAKRQAAKDKLTRAQHQLDEAGDRAETIVDHARDKAPPKPKWWQKALHLAKEFYKGEWEATLGLLKFAWDNSQYRMIVDPVGYAHTVAANFHAATYAAQHPLEFGKAIIDYDTWKTNPARALGHLAPDVALALATGGAGAAATRGASAASKTRYITRAESKLEMARAAALDRTAVKSSIGDYFKNGHSPKAADLERYAVQQGWTKHETPTGPPTYTDQNGVDRMILKEGSARTPGSEHPHVELRNADGDRIDPFGNLVTKKSTGNHTPITWDW